MKIGILVVYLFGDKLQPIFDIHLSRIRAHTKTPFRIYAAGHKLTPAQRLHAEASPEIVFPDFDMPASALNSGARVEHSYCLGQLADFAVADGCTHLICMHMDSFPIADGWEDAFISPIERSEAAVTSIVPNGYSAGLCWSSEFHKRHHPPMLVEASVQDGEEFREFLSDFPSYDHVETGLGVIFEAYRRGLGWKRIGTDEDRKIYGGILFHMVGATLRTLVEAQPVRDTLFTRLLWPVVGKSTRLLPTSAGRIVRRAFVDPEKPSRDGSMTTKSKENEALIADPDGYLADLAARYRGEVTETKGDPTPSTPAENKNQGRVAAAGTEYAELSG